MDISDDVSRSRSRCRAPCPQSHDKEYKTADALNCQKETAEAIVRGKGDYLLDAKGNQPILEEEIREYVQDESLRKMMDCTSTTEKAGIVWKRGLHTPQGISAGFSGGRSGKICVVLVQLRQNLREKV